ncbi:MAG: iron ABC transporter substrate-binding protein [Desulfamplus sp.]|nr:iron ABC transporter substrate-binding protein [Desulfamplus sp.]
MQSLSFNRPVFFAKNQVPGIFPGIFPVILAGLLILTWLILIPCQGYAGQVLPGQTRTMTDAFGRTVSLPEKVERVICSGAGCLRLLTYLNAHDRITAVDSIEIKGAPVDARPYAVANPGFRKYPLFGEFRGLDNPELIAGLDPQPQVILKTFTGRTQDWDQLQTKTGIPVVVLKYGNLTYDRASLEHALRTMGQVMGETQRAEAVIGYFNALEKDIKERVRDMVPDQGPACYVGGLAQRGAHGFQSTEPWFAPFAFLNITNMAAEVTGGKQLSHAVISKEEIVFRDPDIIFLDTSTLSLSSGAGALDQLRNDPAYQGLSAVKNGRVFGLFPYNSYNQNFESIFANAYYIGKVVYPERFSDVEPMEKAEEISIFLNGGPAFEIINRQFDGLAFSQIMIR